MRTNGGSGDAYVGFPPTLSEWLKRARCRWNGCSSVHMVVVISMTVVLAVVRLIQGRAGGKRWEPHAVRGGGCSLLVAATLRSSVSSLGVVSFLFPFSFSFYFPYFFSLLV